MQAQHIRADPQARSRNSSKAFRPIAARVPGILQCTGPLLMAVMLAGWEPMHAGEQPATEAGQSAGTTPAPVQSSEQGTDEATSGSGTSGEERRQARTELNLLGEVDTEAGESRRNENVQLTLVDNNVLKEINVRMGTSATIVRDFEVSSDYFGAEFGMPPQRQIHLAPSDVRDWHAEVYETHGNSLFSARSFFQVGSVQPDGVGGFCHVKGYDDRAGKRGGVQVGLQGQVVPQGDDVAG